MRLRLIVDGPRSPKLNMAIDEAILLAGPDTLRIYMWLPSAVSLGRRTPLEAVNIEAAKRLGVEVVRRPTGGAALYHDSLGEVTYSLIISDPALLELSIPESAARIAEGVARAVRMLGLPAEVGGFRGPGGEQLCYLNPGSSDVVVSGRKVSGSAQLRRGGRILQHGTLLLHFEPHKWHALIPTRTGLAELSRFVAGVSELARRSIGVDEAVEALVEGFREGLGAELYPGSLTPMEARMALELAQRKYSRLVWI